MKYIFVFIQLFLLVSCLEQKRIYDVEDRKYYVLESYGPNGEVRYYCTDTVDGSIYYKFEDSLGRLKREGFFVKGYPIGIHKYYNQEGWLESVEEYVKRDTSIQSYTNQYFHFSKEGDTLKENSNYYKIISNKDTIELGESYLATIELIAPYFNHSIVEGDFDIPNDSSLVRLKPGSTSSIVEYDFTPSVKGDYTMKGWLVEFDLNDKRKDLDSLETYQTRKLYFEQHYFVK